MTTPGYEDPAFEALYRQYFATLVHGLSRIIDAQEAFDAVQEAFLRASARWDRIADFDQPEMWVRRVAVNRLLNELRNRRRRTEILQRLRSHEAVRDGTEGVSIRESLRGLSRQRRNVLYLHYFADYSVAEIAEILGLGSGTVKRYLFEARGELRRQDTKQ